MNKRKIAVVVTARPSYSRVKTALKAIDQHPNLELQLVVAGSALLSRYGSAVSYIEKDGFKIAAKVFNVIEGESLTSAAKTTGIGIIELSTVFENLKPDIVVTIADRFETIATAIAASFMNIPLAHIQGGEVTGNIDEKVRHSISKLADYHFVASQGSLERLIKLGEDSDFIFNTGCPSIDLAAGVLESPEFAFDPMEKYGGVGYKNDINSDYLVVMQHPVTTEYSDARIQIEETLHAIQGLDIPTFWFWPNVDAGSDGTSKGIRAFRENVPQSKIHFFKNMEPEDFLRLLFHAKCLIGNSSVGIRECAYLGVPVVNIGTRQNRRDRGINVIDVEHDSEGIKLAIKKCLDKGKAEQSTVYGGGNAGQNIADILSRVPLVFHKIIKY